MVLSCFNENETVSCKDLSKLKKVVELEILEIRKLVISQNGSKFRPVFCNDWKMHTVTEIVVHSTVQCEGTWNHNADKVL